MLRIVFRLGMVVLGVVSLGMLFTESWFLGWMLFCVAVVGVRL